MSAAEPRNPGWAVTIGRALGIPIRVHFTFVLLLIWYGFFSSQQGHDIVLALVFLLLVFGCVVLHELGHAAMARRYGVRTREIVLYPIGGLARLENIPAGKAELLIALAGPAVNLVLALLLGLVIVATGLTFELPLRLLAPRDLLLQLLIVNVALLLFNLLPAFPMDGGRVLRAALSLTLTQERATEIATAVGQGMAILFGLAGIVSGQILLMLIALFVFIGASQEAAFHRRRAAVEGKLAHQAMVTRFETLAPQDSLHTAAEHLLATHQQDFPVIDAWQRVVGVLSRGALMHGLAQRGADAAVLEVMEREFPVVGPDEPLERVLELLRQRPDCPVIVRDGERVSGMITFDNLVEYIEIARGTALGEGVADQSR